MAIRKIRFIGDPCLNKVCKPVQKITPSIETLIEDMFDTMYEARGVGLAAPQVGILRRICVIDVMDGDPIILINPEIIETAGEQTDEEGCLSIPGKCASVTRADYVKVKSFDMELNPVMSLYLYVLSKAPVYTHLLTWKGLPVLVLKSVRVLPVLPGFAQSFSQCGVSQ